MEAYARLMGLYRPMGGPMPSVDRPPFSSYTPTNNQRSKNRNNRAKAARKAKNRRA